MTEGPERFRALLISREALLEPFGQQIWETCSRGGIGIQELDDAAFDLLEERNIAALIVRVTPPRGWIKPAQHGLLSSRPSEYYLNPIEGCQSVCSYCYLRARSDGL